MDVAHVPPRAIVLFQHRCGLSLLHTASVGFSVAIRARSGREASARNHHSPSFQVHFQPSHRQPVLFTPSLFWSPVLGISSRAPPHWLNQKQPVFPSCPPRRHGHCVVIVRVLIQSPPWTQSPFSTHPCVGCLCKPSLAQSRAKIHRDE